VLGDDVTLRVTSEVQHGLRIHNEQHSTRTRYKITQAKENFVPVLDSESRLEYTWTEVKVQLYAL
jgi:hypothetical protein